MSITSISNDTLGRDSFVNSQKPVPPTITGYSISGIDDIALDPVGDQTILINGNGFQRGATVVIDGTTVPVVSYISSNQLSFTSTAKSAGSYAIYVVNADLGTAIFIPGLIYSELPTWTTDAGSLGSYYETTAISNTVIASGDAPLTYALASGSLPGGATLGSGGVITGTSPVDTGSTTYSFTVEAIDAQLQSSTRSFSLTINTDVVSWNNPANGATVTLDGTEYTNTLAAISAAGYGVTYTADELPEGLTLTNGTISGTPTTQDTTTSVLTATASTTNRSATNTITWVVNLGDLFFPQTTLLLPGSATTFVKDASTNNFPVTVVGDTRPNTFNPHLSGWSNFFDGTGDYLTTPANIALAFGTEDFTVEFWINFTSTTNRQDLIWWGVSGADRGGLIYNELAGNLTYYISPTVARAINYAWTPQIGVWYHIALVRISGSSKLYVNGSQVGSTYTDSKNYASSSYLVTIGKDNSAASSYFFGNMSNLRIVKGTAVYTSNFTPPTSPLTAIAGTSLLTCQSNRFIDNSTNNFTITRNGDVKIQSFSPFVEPATTNGSAYFDGTGDYLSVSSNSALELGSGDYTIEGWWYFTDTSNQALVSKYTGSGGYVVQYQSNNLRMVFNTGGPGADVVYPFSWTPVANVWYHIAITRSGTSGRAFINGVQIGTTTTFTTSNAGTSTTLQIGSTHTVSELTRGYVSNFRLVKGTALYTTAFTPPAVPLTAVANTSLLTLQTNQPANNSQFLDSSSNNLLVTRAGNATQGTFSPYSPSGWSNFFDGNGDFLTVGSSTNLALGAADWTVEAWIYPTSVAIAQNIIADWRNSNSGLPVLYMVNNQVWWRESSATRITSSSTLNANTWYHVAVVKTSTTTTMYINGVSVGSYTDTTNYANADFKIGKAWDANHWNGYISNMRIVKGTAVYTSNFTPSTTPLTAVPGTVLLTCQSPQFVDNSPNRFALTRAGDARVTNFAPYKAVVQTPVSYSAYFDGSGDTLNLPSSSALLGAGNYTVEFWLNMPSAPTGGAYHTCFAYGSTGAVLRCFVLDESGTKLGVWIGATNVIRYPTTAMINNWAHVSLVRVGTTLTIYLNGTSIATYSDSTNYNTGQLYIASQAATNYLAGYISNFRIVTSTAVYTENFTPSTAPLAAVAGTSLLTCQSPSFVDNSTNRFAITATGNTQPTTVNPFGFTFANSTGYTAAEYSGSMYFDGTGDYLTLPLNPAFAIGLSDFTVEAWVYPTAANLPWTVVIGGVNFGSASDWNLHLGNGTTALFPRFQFTNTGADSISSSVAVKQMEWTHIAVTRSSGTAKMFINGVETATANASTWSLNNSIQKGIGGSWNGNSNTLLTGYISNLRVVKGQALYTSNFVPPAAPVEPVANTVLLLNGTSAAITDATTKNVVETVGDARISTVQSKFGGSSMYFDGTGDYLVVPHSSLLDFGSANFTIECWINPSAVLSEQLIFGKRASSANYAPILFGLKSSGGTNRIYILGSTTGSTWNINPGFNNGATAIPVNAWTHIVCVRNGTTITGYVNGVSDFVLTGISGSLMTNTTNAVIGAASLAGDLPINGYIQDLRITNGTARYTANFTPPASAFSTK